MKRYPWQSWIQFWNREREQNKNPKLHCNREMEQESSCIPIPKMKKHLRRVSISEAVPQSLQKAGLWIWLVHSVSQISWKSIQTEGRSKFQKVVQKSKIEPKIDSTLDLILKIRKCLQYMNIEHFVVIEASETLENISALHGPWWKCQL